MKKTVLFAKAITIIIEAIIRENLQIITCGRTNKLFSQNFVQYI